METRFTLTISLQLPQGKLTYGRLSLGKEREAAWEMFSSLKGEMKPISGCHILMEFCEEIQELPVPLGLRYCGLEQLKENIGIISKEIFRISHLENGDADALAL